MAASFAVTLSLGMYLQHLRRPAESGASPTRAGIGARTPGIEMVQGDGPSRQPNNGAFVFPLPSESTSSPGLPASQVPIMPDAVRQALEQAGHRIQQQRVYVPVDLPDGRRAYVPIDRVDVLPAGAAQPSNSIFERDFMMNARWQRMIGGAGILASALSFNSRTAQAADEAPQTPQRVRIIRLDANGADPGGSPAGPVQIIVEAEAKQAGKETEAPAAPVAKYWLGVVCHPLAEYPGGDTLRAQLDLPANTGLVAGEVLPGGPAMKAGVKRHDVLLAADEKPLAAVADLVAAVEKSQGQELSLKLLRAGKQQSIRVKPEQHAQHEPGDLLPGDFFKEIPPGSEREAIEKWMKQLRQVGPPNMGYQLIRPGAPLVFPGEQPKADLPDDVSVDIHREGKKPARIIVKQKDKQWEVAENDLTKLPENLRAAVRPLLGVGPLRINLNALSLPGMPLNPSNPGGPIQLREPGAGEERLEHRLDEMHRQLEELQSAIKNLQHQK